MISAGGGGLGQTVEHHTQESVQEVIWEEVHRKRRGLILNQYRTRPIRARLAVLKGRRPLRLVSY